MSPVDTIRTADTIMASEDEPTYEELLKLVNDMQEDWRTLNRFLNATAASWQWCSSYESRLRTYNEGFRVLSLQGRRDMPPPQQLPACGDPNCEACPSVPRQSVGESKDMFVISGIERLHLCERCTKGQHVEVARTVR